LRISFETENLRACCTRLECAEEAIGAEHARELMTVLWDAEAVGTAAELLDLYTPNAAVYGASISLPIGTGYRLSLEAIGRELVRNSEGGVDWNAVRRLKAVDLSSC